HQGGRRPPLFQRRRSRETSGEVHELQALWSQVEDYLRGPGNLERPAAVGDAATEQNAASSEAVEALFAIRCSRFAIRFSLFAIRQGAKARSGTGGSCARLKGVLHPLPIHPEWNWANLY